MSTYRFAFKEGHSVDVVFYVFSKLLFEGSPGITQIMHLLRAHHLHGGVTLRKQEDKIKMSLLDR